MSRGKSCPWDRFLHTRPLFGLSICCVAHMLPWQLLLILVLAAVWMGDRSLLLAVDYSLLATFGAFFIFIGNMGRVPRILPYAGGYLKQQGDPYRRGSQPGAEQCARSPAAVRVHRQMGMPYSGDESGRSGHPDRIHGQSYFL